MACSFGRLSSGETITANFSVMVDPPAVGTITNTATVLSHEPDPTMTNNKAIETVSITKVADLTLKKTHSPNLTTEVDQIAYTLTVINNGPSDAANVTLVDTLPEGVNFVSSSSDAVECVEADGTVNCGLGYLANEDSATVIILVAPTAEGTITNTANVTAEASDPRTDNDGATETTEFRFAAPGAAELPAPIPTMVPTPVPPEADATPPPTVDGESNLLVILLVLAGLAVLILGILLYYNRWIIWAKRRRVSADEPEIL